MLTFFAPFEKPQVTVHEALILFPLERHVSMKDHRVREIRAHKYHKYRAFFMLSSHPVMFQCF